jgi:hypothetical protein
MKKLRGQLGVTLLEVTLGMAISGIIAVPMVAVLGTQLTIPTKLVSQTKSVQGDQRSILVFSEDPASARTFTAGVEPEYGTFSWFEFSGEIPVLQTSRFFFQDGAVFREMVRSGEPSVSFMVASDVANYGDVTFQHIAPQWVFNATPKTWDYTEGKIDISVTQTVRSEKDETVTFVNTRKLQVDFRPQLRRPDISPVPSSVRPLEDRH